LPKLTHEQRDKLRFICHHCGYDMTGRAEADPCPECNTPFDKRLDLPGAEGRSKRGIAYMLCAIVILPIIPILTFGFIYTAMATVYWLKPKKTDFRIQYHITRRRKTIELLVYVWFIELMSFFWLDEIWPPFLEWW